jgi:mRNA interferase RelE/StbE
MNNYRVIFSRDAAKAYDRLVEPLKSRMAKTIARLGENPRPPGVVKLAGTDNGWRVRVGVYRVLYEIRDQDLIVLVVEIGHRREVYRHRD